MKTVFLTFCLLIIIQGFMVGQNNVKFYGHRGCRGLLPENTIAAFKKALDLGSDGIEWDVVVNKNKELIISHEPYADPQYCVDKSGEPISKNKKGNFYKMTTSEIQEIDCGGNGNPKFPEQKKISSIKPTVQEAFSVLDLTNKTILFEIKSEDKDYGIYQPEPAEYAKIIAAEVENFEFKENIIFMCFDAILLNELHKLLPSYRYVYLTYQPLKSIDSFLSDINFSPYALGMYHITIRKKDIQKAKLSNVKVYAWTVNNQKQCEKLIRYGVEGIITDYPDRIKKKD